MRGRLVIHCLLILNVGVLDSLILLGLLLALWMGQGLAATESWRPRVASMNRIGLTCHKLIQSPVTFCVNKDAILELADPRMLINIEDIVRSIWLGCLLEPIGE